MSAFAPKAHLTAPIWNWGPYYTGIVEQVRQGTWKSSAEWPGLNAGIVDLAPFGAMVPAALKERVLAKKAAIAAGQDDIFTGPIKDQGGKVRIAAGVKATDKELLGMTWFIQGVVGTTE